MLHLRNRRLTKKGKASKAGRRPMVFGRFTTANSLAMALSESKSVRRAIINQFRNVDFSILGVPEKYLGTINEKL